MNSFKRFVSHLDRKTVFSCLLFLFLVWMAYLSSCLIRDRAVNPALSGVKVKIHTISGDYIISQGKDGMPIYTPAK
jgi:hypothetical protein